MFGVGTNAIYLGNTHAGGNPLIGYMSNHFVIAGDGLGNTAADDIATADRNEIAAYILACVS
jgi:hypothetical protein